MGKFLERHVSLKLTQEKRQNLNRKGGNSSKLFLWGQYYLDSKIRQRHQFSSVAQSCLTLCDPMNRSTPGLPVSITNYWSPPKPMSIESVMPSSHLILYHPLLLLPSIFPSIRVFSNESALRIRWLKYWSFSFNISPFSKYSGLISFRIDRLNLLPVQGTLKSLLQHHKAKVYRDKNIFSN